MKTWVPRTIGGFIFGGILSGFGFNWHMWQFYVLVLAFGIYGEVRHECGRCTDE